MRKNYYDLNELMRNSFKGFRADRSIFKDSDYGYIVQSVDGVETEKPSVSFISHPLQANTFVKDFEEKAFPTLIEAFKHIGIVNND